MNLAITNRLTEKSTSAIGQKYSQPVLLSLSQAYDFIEAKKENGLPWQDIRGLLNIRMGVVESLTETFHFPYHKVNNISSRLRFAFLNTNYFEVIYANYLNVPALPEDVNPENRQESTLFSLGTTSNYFSLQGNLEYSLKDSEWKRWTISTSIIPPGDCWIIAVDLFKNLDSNDFGGTGRITFKFGK